MSKFTTQELIILATKNLSEIQEIIGVTGGVIIPKS